MSTKAALDETIRELVKERGEVAPSQVARAAGVTRQTAHAHLRALVESGELTRLGAGRSTHYRPAGQSAAIEATRGTESTTRRYSRAGLDEHEVWKEVEPLLEVMSPSAREIARYATTELVNNAVDHSGGNFVEVTARGDDAAIAVDVVDDGIGIFERVQSGLGLGAPIEAIEQLHKGKTTTMPDRHTGEGLFFISKAVDVLDVRSGVLRWMVDNDRGDMSILASQRRSGTLARFRIRRNTPRRLRAEFDSYTDDFEFARTRVVVRLFEHGEHFISRAEAKRLLLGLERFREVVLDFAGVQGVGQAFADEVFRVWARLHPHVRLSPVAMNEPVAFMVERAVRAAAR